MKSALWRCGRVSAAAGKNARQNPPHRPARRGFDRSGQRAKRGRNFGQQHLACSAGTATSNLCSTEGCIARLDQPARTNHASAARSRTPQRTSSGPALRRRQSSGSAQFMPGTPTPRILPQRQQAPARDHACPLAMLPPSRGMQGSQAREILRAVIQKETTDPARSPTRTRRHPPRPGLRPPCRARRPPLPAWISSVAQASPANATHR